MLETDDPKNKCVSCSEPRIVGRGFTKFHCKSCKASYLYRNTDTPKLCNKCSKEKNVCAWCEGLN